MDLYNDSHEKVCILSGIKETCITSTLKTGDKEITFEFRKTNRYAADIKEEGYIRTDTDEFVIKQVEPSGEWYKCTGTLNVEELEGKQYPQGFETVEKTVDESPPGARNPSMQSRHWCKISDLFSDRLPDFPPHVRFPH